MESDSDGSRDTNYCRASRSLAVDEADGPMAGVSSVWLNIEPDLLWEREWANEDFTATSERPEDMLANFLHRAWWRTT